MIRAATISDSPEGHIHNSTTSEDTAILYLAAYTFQTMTYIGLELHVKNENRRKKDTATAWVERMLPSKSSIKATNHMVLQGAAARIPNRPLQIYFSLNDLDTKEIRNLLPNGFYKKISGDDNPAVNLIFNEIKIRARNGEKI